MLGESLGCPEPSYQTKCVDSVRQPTIMEALQDKQARLKNQLASVDEAIKQLQDNPQVTKALEAINKAIRL